MKRLVLLFLSFTVSGGVRAQMPSAATIYALETMGTTVSPVLRESYTAAGDGGGAIYHYDPARCAAADNGLQVQSVVSPGCWIADFKLTQPTPKVWGCVGDGVHDDTSCLQYAFNAMGHATLYNGRYSYCIKGPGITVSYPITYVGAGIDPTAGLTPVTNFGLLQCEPNVNAITVKANATTFRDLVVTANKGGANTAGATFTVNGTANSVAFENVKVDAPCIGFDVSGNTITLERVSGINLSGTGCYGVRVGHETDRAGTEEVRIMNSNFAAIPAKPPSAGMRIEDVGGLTISNTDSVGTGTVFCPGERTVRGHDGKYTTYGQEVDWAAVVKTEFGDTLHGPALAIDTCSKLGVMKGAMFDTVWASTSLDDHGVSIRNTAGGLLKGIHFVGLRSYQNHSSAMFVGTSNVSDLTIDASAFCGNGRAGSNTFSTIFVAAGVRNFALRNSRISDQCDSFSPPVSTNTALELAGNDTDQPGNINDNLVIVGNDFSGNVAPAIKGTPSNYAANITVANNAGVDGVATPIASASTITVGYNPVYALTGSTDIQSIQGHPSNWMVTLIPTDAPITFLAGGGICHAFTAVRYSRVVLSWLASSSCWAS